MGSEELSSQKPGMFAANNAHPALSLPVDVVVPLHRMAAAQEFAFLILCLFMALDAP